MIAGAALAAWLILPAAGRRARLPAGAAIVVPGCAALVGPPPGAARPRPAPALSGELVETIDGAAELAVAGRAGERVERLRRADARLARLARRDALAAGAHDARLRSPAV